MIKSIALLIIGILIVDSSVVTVSFLQQSGKLREAEVNASALETQVNQLNGEMAALRGRVANLQSQIASSEENASSLQERLQTSEMNLTMLQEQLMNKVQILNQVPVPGQAVQPAAFSVDNLTITPGTVERGKTVTVVAAVTNTGGQAGTYRADLQIREYSQQIYDDKGGDVTLAAGSSGNVTFVITMFDPGHYVLSVENVLRDLLVI